MPAEETSRPRQPRPHVALVPGVSAEFGHYRTGQPTALIGRDERAPAWPGASEPDPTLEREARRSSGPVACILTGGAAGIRF